MKLFFQKSGHGAPLIILHGLYGSSENWASIGKKLETYFTVYIVDLRNHGKSPHHPIHDYQAMEDDLMTFFSDQKIERAVLLGHSMGGKLAMYFALMHCEKIERLIVADIAPVKYDPDASSNSWGLTHTKIIEAIHSVDLDGVIRRADADKLLAAHISSKKVRQFLLKNLERVDGKELKWRINLEALRKYMPEIMNGPVFIKDKFTVNKKNSFKTLFIKGENSPYIQDENLDIIEELFPGATIEVIPDAGHWVHYEQPENFIRTVKSFVLQNELD